MKLVTALQLAGWLHLSLIIAGLTMPRVVQMREHLQQLPPFLRQLFWVYYLFIGSSIIGFGTLTIVFAELMAAGQPLARALAIFFAGFWALRLVVSMWGLDVRPYLKSPLHRVGYYGLNLVFLYLLVIYGWTAIHGGGW